MEEKKALVFDTNFIKKNNKNFKDVIEKIIDDFSVYITQVSIEERIGQKCREDKQAYEELEKRSKKSVFFASVEFKYSVDDIGVLRRKSMQNSYFRIFKNNIIPLNSSKFLLEDVLKRACDKLPPFSSDSNASDKGFKDYLMWNSIITFFIERGEAEVLFLTDDKGFLDNKGWLENEFYELTKKKIEIKPNDYYKSLASESDKDLSLETADVLEIANIEELREEIEQTFLSITQTETENEYGFPCVENTYTTHVYLLPEDTKEILDKLPSLVSKHVFEKQLSVYEVFDIEPGNIIGYYTIDIKNLEKAIRLYNKIKEKYSKYLEQFIVVVTKIINGNYEAIIEDEDELPF